jgi:hypothetical protein
MLVATGQRSWCHKTVQSYIFTFRFVLSVLRSLVLDTEPHYWGVCRVEVDALGYWLSEGVIASPKVLLLPPLTIVAFM